MEQDKVSLEKTLVKKHIITIDTNTIDSDANFTSPRENFKTIGSNIISSNFNTFKEIASSNSSFKPNKRLVKSEVHSMDTINKSTRSQRNPSMGLSFKVSNFNSTNSLQNSIYAYTIPKEERFRGNINKLYTDTIYTITESKINKGTSLGLGDKSSLVNSKTGPGPQQYNILSIFEKNKQKHRGLIIGEKLPYKLDEEGKTPGPQNYFTPIQWKKQNPLTLKFRHGFYYDEEMKYKGPVLSPQKYKPNFSTIEATRYQNIKISIGVGSKSSMLNNNKSPGPGDYNLPSIFDLKRKNKYALN